MNNKVLAVIVVVVVALVGYFGWYKPQQDAKAAMEAAAAEAAATQAAEAAAAEKAAADKAAADQAAADQAAADAAAADAAATGQVAVDPATLLTPEGFNADQVIALIEGSNLSAQQKSTLSGAVRVGANNPALLGAALDNVKLALGL